MKLEKCVKEGVVEEHCLWEGLYDYTESGEGMCGGVCLEEVGYKHLIGK